jgi:hypothetical protein
MNQPNPMRYLLGTLLFFVCHQAAAQPPSKRSCRVLFLAEAGSVPQKIQLHDGTVSREVDLPTMNLSKPYSLPGGPLVLRLTQNPSVEPADIDPASPKISLAESLGDFYLLVTKDPSNAVLPLKMQVIDSDASKFKMGQMLWYNLTANQVGGLVGSEKLAMEPNSKVTLNPPASSNVDYNVNLSYRRPGDERLHPLFETKWQHDTRSKVLVFVINEAGSRMPRVMGFPDYPIEPPSNP